MWVPGILPGFVPSVKDRELCTRMVRFSVSSVELVPNRSNTPFPFFYLSLKITNIYSTFRMSSNDYA